MRAKLLTEGPPRQYAVVFDTGEEVVSGLNEWTARSELPGSAFTGIGAFQEAVLAYYDLQAREYEHIPVDGQVEVLVLAGDITRSGAGWKVHAHTVCGRRDGSTVGGHLVRAVVRPTLELIVTVSPTHLQRREDAASGLALIDLRADSE